MVNIHFIYMNQKYKMESINEGSKIDEILKKFANITKIYINKLIFSYNGKNLAICNNKFIKNFNKKNNNNFCFQFEFRISNKSKYRKIK